MAIANSNNSLVILQNEIHQVDGLYSLNDLHKASGGQPKNKPLNFLRLQQAIDLVNEIEHCSDMNSALKVVNGGNNRGTYACKQLVIAYAAWISPTVNLAVIDAFLDKQEASPFNIPQTFAQAMLLGAQQAEELEKVKCEVIELKPKAQFHDRVAIAEDCISISKAAKTLGTGRNRLMTDLRRIKWISKRNEPYQDKIEQGLMDIKLGNFDHPDHGLTQSITPLITGKGLTKLSVMLGGAQ